MIQDRIDLLRAAKAGDVHSESQLLEQNMGLLKSVEKRFYGRGIEPEDLHQLACIGFIKAVRGYDENYGTAFSTYAVPKIMGEIRRQLRDDGPIKISRQIYENSSRIRWLRSEMENALGRSPTVSELSEQCGLSIEEIAVCDRTSFRVESIDEACFDSDSNLLEFIAGEEIEEGIVIRETLRQALARLPDRLSQIVTLRYFHELTQAQTAKIVGVSQVQVSRLEKKALLQLRQEMI